MLKRLTIAALLLASTPALAADDKPTLTVYTYDSFASEWGLALALSKPSKASADAP